AHKPVLEQDEAVGHAVRAAYMYSGMAAVAALTGDPSYIKAIDAIWDNIVSKKMYITGGIGSTNNGEAFGDNYELPNMSAYCETCAAIAHVYMNHRLFLLHGESKYYDVLERTLYNGLISGVSLDGGRFFYPNPLESIGQHQRQPWFGCACCPSNVSRFIPSLPGYVYAVKDANVFVNLFMANNANLTVNGKKLNLVQQTGYPWNGDIEIQVNPSSRQEFNIRIRIPGWVTGKVAPSDLYKYADRKNLSYSVQVNGEPVESKLEDGYFVISRRWKKGDIVNVHFDMEPRTVKAHPEVEADRGRIAIERGPLVYCAEWPDNDFSVLSIIMNQRPQFELIERPDLLEGIVQLKTGAQILSFNEEGRIEVEDVQLIMIPYYAWAHRGSGEMSVWLPNELNATRPVMPPSIASESKISASLMTRSISAINDRLLPKNKEDRSAPYYHWWPKEGTTEWIAYEFSEKKSISGSSVFWFDDGPWGGCRTPQSWRLYYKDSQGEWTPVENTEPYGTEKGVNNFVPFKAVTTDAVKIEIDLPERHSAGIFEWSIE
ncbi:MAG TPA: glycoside hydrolase family 127 protein, partial [Paludibacter sp.]|nr:glycoside hydrolase family 127 protein [Paludibacter sp.]